MIDLNKSKNFSKLNFNCDQILKPFEKRVIEFLQQFSNSLMKDKSNLEYPEIIAFAYWIRRSNLKKLQKNLNILTNEYRIGRGLILHIPPSNVITGFLYSWVFGLLSGNSNIIKIPSSNNSVNLKIINLIKKILSKKKNNFLAKNNFFVSYNNNEDINKILSLKADCRLIWGGDKTVEKFKSYKTKIHNIDLVFADRYSFSVIKLNEKTNIKHLVEGFYNDAFLMDQNACSSPHLLIWYKTQEHLIDNFWSELEMKSKIKYKIDIGNAFKKFESKINNLINVKNFSALRINGKTITRIELNKLQNGIENLRGKFGQFFEFKTNDTSFLKIVSKKYQTLSVHGVSKNFLIDKITLMKLKGIDRVVDVGKSNSITLLWDGYDIIRTLSRVINDE